MFGQEAGNSSHNAGPVAAGQRQDHAHGDQLRVLTSGGRGLTLRRARVMRSNSSRLPIGLTSRLTTSSFCRRLSVVPSRLFDRATMAMWGSGRRSEEHTSELQALMRISYAVFCLKKKNNGR